MQEQADRITDGRRTGRITKWNDERGFGFLQPDDAGETVFVHISDFANPPRRPQEEDRVTFRVVGDRGRTKAVEVRMRALPLPDTVTVAYGVGVLMLTILLLHALGLLQLAPPQAFFLAMSVVTFGFYYVDKKRAERRERRISRFTLHVLEGLGGWPGALLAMAMLRHLTRRRDHMGVLAAIIAIHVGGWMAWLLLH